MDQAAEEEAGGEDDDAKGERLERGAHRVRALAARSEYRCVYTYRMVVVCKIIRVYLDSTAPCLVSCVGLTVSSRTLEWIIRFWVRN